MWQYLVRDWRVIDGDTLDVTLDLGFSVSTRQRLRSRTIDAPEIRGPQRARGLLASVRLLELLAGATEVRVRTEVDPRSSKNREKYGRYLCDVLVTKNGTDWIDVWETLAAEGHVKTDADRAAKTKKRGPKK